MASEGAEDDSDLVECEECGTVFAALLCPAPDCLAPQKGLRLITPAESAVLDAIAEIPDASWEAQRTDGFVLQSNLAVEVLALRGKVYTRAG